MKNIDQLQLLQQNMQSVLGQRQQLQSQLMELDSALTELKTTTKAYRIVGKIMVASSKEALQEDLKEQKNLVSARLKNFEQQEERLKKNIHDVQQNLVREKKNTP